MSDGADRALLDEQIAYYRARAPEYDEWFLRQGRYDRGPEQRARWRAELAEVEAALRAARPRGRVLELAAGTGLWTRRLASLAAWLTAVDASPEALERNRARVRDARVRSVVADIFAWEPDGPYDFAFFGFWISHVPSSRFADFWGRVRRALAPGGRAFFVDNAYNPDSTALDQTLRGDGTAERRLNDGRRFTIVKRFYEPGTLAAELAALGWRAEVRKTARYFVHGCAEPAPGAD